METTNYDVYVGECSVYFEHKEYGDEDALCAYHEKDSKRIHDYDMAYGMYDEIREWLDGNGYNTEDILE